MTLPIHIEHRGHTSFTIGKMRLLDYVHSTEAERLQMIFAECGRPDLAYEVIAGRGGDPIIATLVLSRTEDIHIIARAVCLLYRHRDNFDFAAHDDPEGPFAKMDEFMEFLTDLLTADNYDAARQSIRDLYEKEGYPREYGPEQPDRRWTETLHPQG